MTSFLLTLHNQLPCFQRILQKMEKQPVGKDLRNGVCSVRGFGAPLKMRAELGSDYQGVPSS